MGRIDGTRFDVDDDRRRRPTEQDFRALAERRGKRMVQELGRAERVRRDETVSRDDPDFARSEAQLEARFYGPFRRHMERTFAAHGEPGPHAPRGRGR